ncbi:MAG: RNA methyltransferase [Ignavibacteriales bacterium]|nr:RNA methyltransferase [Ignavibacteriales bacterium]
MKTYKNISHSLLKSYSKLTQRKYRQNDRKFLVEGVHLVEEVLNSDWEVEAIIINSKGFVKEVGKFGTWEVGNAVPMYECSEKDFKKLSDTVTSQGIVAVVKMEEFPAKNLWNQLPRRSVIVAMDEITDPGNAGTILRTCDWFGVDAALVGNNSVDLFNPKVLRATMGAVFHFPILTDINLDSMLSQSKEHKFKIITTVLDSGNVLNRFSFPDRSIIVLGNEARGVSESIKNLSDELITIPKYGKAESLNVAISCGIILNAVRLGAGQ